MNIETIAHSLSMICRWGGHTKTWNSVAEHSVRVCNCLSGKDRCYGILHDAAEATWGDLISPLKKELPDYCAAIEKLQREIYSHFGLNGKVPEAVKVADLKIRQFEYENYVIGERNSWPQRQAYELFMGSFLANNVIT